RQGHQPDEAQDLTQAFFARLLEKHYLQSADPGRGRFRSFLLTAFKRFLSKERDRERTKRRGGRGGGGAPGVRGRASGDRAGQGAGAERIWERRWALRVLDGVSARWRDEPARAGKPKESHRLKVYLTGEAGTPRYQEAAAELGMTEGAVKVAVHRLRRRYRV